MMTSIPDIEERLSSDGVKKGLKEAEKYVQYVNQKFISINDEDHKSYAEDLQLVLSKLVTHMKENDSLFATLYQKERFAGSYADGLKIGKPTEYDINLIIKLPLDYSKLQLEEATPSFVKIHAGKALEAAGALKYKDILAWIDKEEYILQNKFREWMESVLSKAFKNLPVLDTMTKDNTKLLLVEKDGKKLQYKVNHKKSGPALTLKVTTSEGVGIDVDLVPAFEFEHPIWPSGVRELPGNCKKKFWMVIPKPKRLQEGDKPNPEDDRKWRVSFLDQERELLHGSGTVKPTIKLLKKLRDTTKTVQLSSYAIKTAVLWEMDSNQEKDFWKNRMTYLFLVMLRRLIDFIKRRNIPFYWDQRDNLLNIGESQCDNISGRLSNILKDILRVIETNPDVVMEKLLSKEEFQMAKSEMFGVGGSQGFLSLSSPGYMARAIGSTTDMPFSTNGCEINEKVVEKYNEGLQRHKNPEDNLSEIEDLKRRVSKLENIVGLLMVKMNPLQWNFNPQ